jgi:hypothetical protein
MTKALQSVSRLAPVGPAREGLGVDPVSGALSGAGVTAIIQSSSVTTVLTVGFVCRLG